MGPNIIQSIFIIFFPAFAILLGNRSRIFKWLSRIAKKKLNNKTKNI